MLWGTLAVGHSCCGKLLSDTVVEEGKGSSGRDHLRHQIRDARWRTICKTRARSGSMGINSRPFFTLHFGITHDDLAVTRCGGSDNLHITIAFNGPAHITYIPVKSPWRSTVFHAMVTHCVGCVGGGWVECVWGGGWVGQQSHPF